MATRKPSDPTVAERIQLRRQARGWSIRHAADRAGLAASTWSRIERGMRAADNRFVLADIAQALECSVAELTGMPLRTVDRDTEAAQAGMLAVRRALLEAEFAEPGDVAPRPIEQLAAETDLVRALRVKCDYFGVTRLLPRLLFELHAAAHGRERRSALELLVQATYTASSVAKYLGYPAESWIGAQQCRDVAEVLEKPVLIGFAAFATTHAAMACDSFSRARSLARRAVDELAPQAGVAGGLETLGMLQLTAGYAARAARQTGESAAWMAEAHSVAERTGETNTLDMAFGPTNVRLWQIAIEVDGGDPGRAVQIASETNPALVSSPNRQAAFYADPARALARLNKDRNAGRMLVTAASLAPQQNHPSPLVQESARSLLERARREAGGPELRGLCERMGLPV